MDLLRRIFKNRYSRRSALGNFFHFARERSKVFKLRVRKSQSLRQWTTRPIRSITSDAPLQLLPPPPLPHPPKRNNISVNRSTQISQIHQIERCFIKSPTNNQKHKQPKAQTNPHPPTRTLPVKTMSYIKISQRESTDRSGCHTLSKFHKIKVCQCSENVEAIFDFRRVERREESTFYACVE